jgi:hypothetical protein
MSKKCKDRIRRVCPSSHSVKDECDDSPAPSNFIYWFYINKPSRFVLKKQQDVFLPLAALAEVGA